MAPQGPAHLLPALVFPLLAGAILIGFVVASVRALRRWQGRWRIAAVTPPLAMALVAANIVVGVLLDRTAHNLWPFELLMAGLGGLVFFGLAALLRWALAKLGPAGPQ